MDTSRTVETWWNRGDGQSSINQATDHAVKVYNQDGSLDSQDLYNREALAIFRRKNAGVRNNRVYRWGWVKLPTKSHYD